MLVLLDEMNFVLSSFRHQVTQQDLAQFQTILSRLNPNRWGSRHRRWGYLVGLLQQASTQDLRCTEWAFPLFTPEWAFAVQALGWDIFGASFRFLGYDLQQFSHSLLDSRERGSRGDLLFATPPYLGRDFVILSDSAHQEFAHFRLGHVFASPFADYHFVHPETQWFNLASRLGTRRFFLTNAHQILDFFASLIAHRLQQGRRPLLITKKCFVSLFALRLTTSSLPDLLCFPFSCTRFF